MVMVKGKYDIPLVITRRVKNSNYKKGKKRSFIKIIR